MYFIGYLDSDGNGVTKEGIPFIEAGFDEADTNAIVADLVKDKCKNIIVAFCDWKRFDEIVMPGDNRPTTWQMLYAFQDERWPIVNQQLEMSCDIDKDTFMNILFNIGNKLPQVRAESYNGGVYNGLLAAIDVLFAEIEIYKKDAFDDED